MGQQASKIKKAHKIKIKKPISNVHHLYSRSAEEVRKHLMSEPNNQLNSFRLLPQAVPLEQPSSSSSNRSTELKLESQQWSSYKMSSNKMDLDAIDQLAWFRILQFMDDKSRLQCRHLFITIKAYVDHSGLTIHIWCLKPFESEKEEWKAFLKNPNIYFYKVYFSSGDRGLTSADDVGLTPRHSVNYLIVEHLASRSFNEMSSLLKTDWTQNIETLVCTSNSLVLIAPLEGHLSNINLPLLRNMYLIYIYKDERRGQRQKVQDLVRIVSILLRKIRSLRMELIYVNLSDGDFDIEETAVILSDSLAEFVQLHSKTLQTVIVKGDMGMNERPNPKMNPSEIREIPYNLKHFEVDFFGYLDAESPWYKMLNASTRHLKKFVNKLHAWTYSDDELNYTEYPNLLANLCQLNCNTLNNVFLTILQNILAMDLKAFNCCNTLEHLHLEIQTVVVPVYLKNLAMLPVSIKSFRVEHLEGLHDDHSLLGGHPRIALELEDVSSFHKLKNLVTFWLNAPASFQNSEQLIHFTKVLVNLRKLDFFELADISLIDRDTLDSFQERKLFYNTLCERDLTRALGAESRFKMQLVVKLTNASDYYDFMYGHLDLSSRIEKKVFIPGSPVSCQTNGLLATTARSHSISDRNKLVQLISPREDVELKVKNLLCIKQRMLTKPGYPNK